LIVVRYGFNLVFVVRMVLNVRLNWLYDVKKEKPHPIVVDEAVVGSCKTLKRMKQSKRL
jgi:hypothetical protein